MDEVAAPKFEAGQTVLVVGYNHKPYESTVTRVGRKLVYVEQYGREVAFRIESGVVNDGYGHSRLTTLERFAARDRVAVLVKELREVGIEFRFGSAEKWAEQIAQVVGVPSAQPNHQHPVSTVEEEQ